jgi:hypothetical protein
MLKNVWNKRTKARIFVSFNPAIPSIFSPNISELEKGNINMRINKAACFAINFFEKGSVIYIIINLANVFYVPIS